MRRGHDDRSTLSRRRPATASCRPSSSDANGSFVFHSGCCGASAFTRSSANSELEVHRLLGPERAVVVERRRCARRRHEVGRAFRRHLLDEVDDRLSARRRSTTAADRRPGQRRPRAAPPRRPRRATASALLLLRHDVLALRRQVVALLLEAGGDAAAARLHVAAEADDVRTGRSPPSCRSPAGDWRPAPCTSPTARHRAS